MGFDILNIGKTLIFILLITIFGANISLAGNQTNFVNFGFIEIPSQSPLQQLRYGIVHHDPFILKPKQASISFRHNWKNMWLYIPDAYLIDAEIHEISIRYRIGISDGLELGALLPVRNVSGGMLDDVIETFHNTIGTSNAFRDQFSQNSFVFAIKNGSGYDNWSYAGEEQRGWNLGNMTVSLSANLNRFTPQKISMTTTFTVKLPTGTRTEYFGSQSVDIGLSLSAGGELKMFRWYTGAGLVYYSDQEMIGIKLHQWHYSGLFALEYMPNRGRDAWTVQLLVERGIAVDFYQFSNSTYELMFGYQKRLTKTTTIELGFIENLFTFDNSPDIVLHSALKHNF